MKNDYFIAPHLFEIFNESDKAIKRAISKDSNDWQKNGTLHELWDAIYNYDENCERWCRNKSPEECEKIREEEKERILKNIDKVSSSRLSNQAGYTWQGTSQLKRAFVNNGIEERNTPLVPGDTNTYTDTMWYYIDPNTNKLASYLDENGMIKPGHEDVIERINKKYGLHLDPTQSMFKSSKISKKADINSLPNNVQQFIIWRDNYFVPWLKDHSNEGKDLKDAYKIYVTHEMEGRKEFDRKEIKFEPVKDYDKSVIDDIVNSFSKTPAKTLVDLKMLANGTVKNDYSKQKIYNTMKNLLRQLQNNRDLKGKYTDTEENLADMIRTYKGRNPEIVESADEHKSNWLTNNGDYKIFDKLNGLFRFNAKESTMNKDNRTVLQEGNTFHPINTNENEFDPSKVTSDIFNDEETSAMSEKDETKKNKLVKKVLGKINNSLKLNKEVQDILDEIRKINNHNDYNTWIVNEEGNTATLASKNAKIFKQNLNLCLSHDDKIEIFKSVAELHNWLKEHRYPLPKNIQLHESINLKEADINKTAGWEEIKGLVDKNKELEKELDNKSWLFKQGSSKEDIENNLKNKADDFSIKISYLKKDIEKIDAEIEQINAERNKSDISNVKRTRLNNKYNNLNKRKQELQDVISQHEQEKENLTNVSNNLEKEYEKYNSLKQQLANNKQSIVDIHKEYDSKLGTFDPNYKDYQKKFDNNVNNLIDYDDIVYADNDPRAKYNGLGIWTKVLGLDSIGQSEDEYRNKEESVIEEDFCCGNMGDTTSASLGTAVQYLYKNKKRESLEKGAFIDKLKELKEDDTDVASNFDASIQSNAGFGSDDSTDSVDAPTNKSLSSNDMQQDDTVDLGQGDSQGEDSLGDFGNLNIDTGYGPEDGSSEDASMDMSIPQEQFQILNVLTDNDDNIKVEVKNLNSGEIEYRDLSEIDI